jgi:putative ABC transport system permease protein
LYAYFDFAKWSVEQMMLSFKLAWQQLRSQWQAGDLRVLLLALVLAVSSITAVNFFTYRIAAHLNNQGGMLLGGDAVIIADHAIPTQYSVEAKQHGLQAASTLEFASMAIKADKNILAEIKALDDQFPLIGDFDVMLESAQFLAEKVVKNVRARPAKGEVWVEPRLANALNLKLGDQLELGAIRLKVAGILLREPSRGGDMFSFAPRVMMHMDDVPATELIQFGSRVKYQLVLAGNAENLKQVTSKMTPNLKRGERIEDVKTARPEIRSALDKAEIFLGLSAMVSVVLAIVAMLLASAPFVARSQEAAALLRCFGASKATIENIMLIQTAMLAAIGGVAGCLLGYLVQFGLAHFAGKLFLETLPAPNLTPVAMGLLLSFAILFAIMLPHIRALKDIPTIQILRRNFVLNPSKIWLNYLPVIVVITVLIFLLAKTFKLALAFLVGIFGICLVAGVLAYGLALLLHRVSLSKSFDNTISLGMGNLKRRLGLSIAQIIGFSLGAMVLMLLVMIKTDLMQSWQSSLPVDAPNRFIINIQQDQIEPVKAFVRQISANSVNPQVFAMIRGRLIEKNGQPINAEMFTEERAKRLVSREFNLSSAAVMQTDNKLLEGRWWRADEATAPLLSLEFDIAQALNIKLGDTLTYDIAGSKITLTVTSIRKVEWDSMRANFFAVTPPETLAQFSASYMTAFYLPKSEDSVLNSMLQQFPNFTVIDVASIMNQVRDIMSKLATAVSFIFVFCVLAGVVVLYASLVATRSARLQEASLLRAFGASRKQVTLMLLTEFASIAVLASIVAVLVASGLSYYLSRYVLDITYQFNLPLALSVLVIALVFIPLAAWLVIRGYLNVAPKQLLNSI